MYQEFLARFLADSSDDSSTELEMIQLPPVRNDEGGELGHASGEHDVKTDMPGSHNDDGGATNSEDKPKASSEHPAGKHKAISEEEIVAEKQIRLELLDQEADSTVQELQQPSQDATPTNEDSSAEPSARVVYSVNKQPLTLDEFIESSNSSPTNDESQPKTPIFSVRIDKTNLDENAPVSYVVEYVTDEAEQGSSSRNDPQSKTQKSGTAAREETFPEEISSSVRGNDIEKY